MKMRCSGFSLFELVVVLALISLSVAIGIPSYREMLDKNEQQILVATIQSAVQFSKHRAAQLDYPLYLIPKDKDGNWSSGLRLTRGTSNGDEMSSLFEWSLSNRSWSLKWQGVNLKNRIVVYKSPISAMSNGRFVLEHRITHEKVVVALNRLGRVKQLKIV